MAEINHEIKIKASREKIREALRRPKELEAWHGGCVTESDGALRFDFEDAPTFRWSVQQPSADQISWRCIEGPGDLVGTEASFTLSDADKDRTLIEFVHRGWPDTGGNFRKCNTHWAALLHQLRRHVETGVVDPVFH